MAIIKIGGCQKNFLKNWRFEKKMLSKMGRKFFKILFSQIFSKQILFFMSNLNVECFQLSFDIHIVHVGQKMTNFQKLWYRKLENFRVQSRLLRRHLKTKLCNLGRCSKALEVDKDASFHLRPCLVDF